MEYINPTNFDTDIVGNSVHADKDFGFKSETAATLESYTNQGLDLFCSMQSVVGNASQRAGLVDMVTESVSTSLESDTIGDVSALANANFYSNYGDRVTQSVENSAREVVKESVMFGYSPIVAYNPFFVKKEWIDNIFKDVLMSEVPKKPKIEIGFERRYLQDLEGNKYPLPEALYDKELSKKLLDASTGAAIDSTKEFTAFNTATNLIDAGFIPGVVIGDTSAELTQDLVISAVNIVYPDSVGATGLMYEVPTQIGLDASMSSQFVKGSFTVPAREIDNGGILVPVPAIKLNLFGTVDIKNCTVIVTAIANTETDTPEAATVSYVKFTGKIANRFNQRSIAPIREVERITKYMPESGPRLNSEITIEQAADAIALQNIDIISDNISVMGATLAALEDGSIKAFLDNSFEVQKAAGVSYIYNELGHESLIVETGYNMLPRDGYTGTLSASIPDIRIFFENAISAMKTKLRAQNIVIVAVCHPDTVRYLNEINWVFTNDTQISGVKLNYNFGIYTSAQDRVHIVTTQRMSATEGIKLIPIPLSQDLITFKNYRYSVMIDRGYRNPVHDLVPNIMATQRTLTFEVIPVQGHIDVKGMPMFSPDNLIRP